MFEQIINDLEDLAPWELQDLADEVGLTAQCIKYWLNGKTCSPLLHNFIPVARALGYTVEVHVR